jgi:hypothetical protein
MHSQVLRQHRTRGDKYRSQVATARISCLLLAVDRAQPVRLELTRFLDTQSCALRRGRSVEMGRSSKYPEEFRREAVALYRSSDRSRADVAKSLGISDGSQAARAKADESAEEPCTPHDPVRIHRRLLQPPTPPSPSWTSHTGRNLRCLHCSMDHNNPCSRSRVNSKPCWFRRIDRRVPATGWTAIRECAGLAPNCHSALSSYVFGLVTEPYVRLSQFPWETVVIARTASRASRFAVQTELERGCLVRHD